MAYHVGFIWIWLQWWRKWAE